MSPLPSLVPERTPLLDLPLIMPSQAQKHVTHNEAIRALDSLAHLGVVASGAAEPPADAQEGDRFIVGPEPAGDWSAARADQVAALEDGAWTFYTPRLGWRAFVANSGTTVIHNGTAWVEAASSGERVERLGVGTDADDTNRLAVSAPATLLTHSGTDHRVVVNRASADDTASLVFQTAWSGRAEFGLSGGGDSWHVKVSEDGAEWREALVADPATGAVGFPHGAHPERFVPPPAMSGFDADEVIGPPNLATVPLDRAAIIAVQNRLYASAFLVDRPTVLLGLNVAQQTASTTAGALWRAGVHRLGSASGDGWRLGERVVDCGTAPADSAGHKRFDAPSPVTLEPGWYASVIVTDGASAKLRTPRWMTPGLTHVVPHSSGTGADFRVHGASSYLILNNQASLVADGLPSSWSDNMSITRSWGYYAVMLALPRWRRW